MKKLILLLCCLISNAVAMAEAARDWQWRLVGEMPDGSPMYVEMDPADHIGYWVKLIPKNNDLSKTFQSKGYSYMVNHISVDCSTKEQTIDSLLIYDIHHNLAYIQPVSSTRTLPDGTPGDKLMKIFCQRK